MSVWSNRYQYLIFLAFYLMLLFGCYFLTQYIPPRKTIKDRMPMIILGVPSHDDLEKSPKIIKYNPKPPPSNSITPRRNLIKPFIFYFPPWMLSKTIIERLATKCKRYRIFYTSPLTPLQLGSGVESFLLTGWRGENI